MLPLSESLQVEPHHESLGKHCSFIHTKIRTPRLTDLLSEIRSQGPQRALPQRARCKLRSGGSSTPHSHRAGPDDSDLGQRETEC